MGSEYREKIMNADLCEKCPARHGEVFTAKLRGSSFRGRLIRDGEEFTIDNCIIAVRDFLIANVQIANIDMASAEQDAEVLTSIFETSIDGCQGPAEVATGQGIGMFCTPINKATDDFIDVNYDQQ